MKLLLLNKNNKNILVNYLHVCIFTSEWDKGTWTLGLATTPISVNNTSIVVARPQVVMMFRYFFGWIVNKTSSLPSLVGYGIVLVREVQSAKLAICCLFLMNFHGIIANSFHWCQSTHVVGSTQVILDHLIKRQLKELKEPSQPRLCFCWHTGFPVLYFTWSVSKRKRLPWNCWRWFNRLPLTQLAALQ